MTSGNENLQPRSGAAPSPGAPGGPPASPRRWLPFALAGIVVVVVAAAAVGASVARRPPPPAPAFRGAIGADAWSLGRLGQFRRDCADGSAGTIPNDVRPGDDAAADRFCRCVTDGLAAAFPSYRRGRHAYFQSTTAADQGAPAGGGDEREAAEIVRRCVAASR